MSLIHNDQNPSAVFLLHSLAELASGKAKRILCSDWLPARDFPPLPRKKLVFFLPYNKFVMNQVFSVKMARYWFRSCLRCYLPRLRLGL